MDLRQGGEALEMVRSLSRNADQGCPAETLGGIQSKMDDTQSTTGSRGAFIASR